MPSAMATAVHHQHHLLLLLLRPLSALPRRPYLSCSPRRARLCSSLLAPGCRLATHTVALAEPEWKEEDQFVVVTFYKFVPLEDPRAEVARHLHFLQGHDIHGRIYLNEQGINAQYSGSRKDAMAYADWLRKDPRFCDMLVQTSPAWSRHAFPRLKLRYKPSLVQLEGGSSHLPLVDPSMRARPLAPSEWKERLEASKCLDVFSSKTSGETFGRKLLLLDMDPSDPLNGVDKEKTDILMYCTGGIRCDVYSTILRRVFRNLYTLEGGVSHYLKMEGTAGWVGNLFVFDGRLSLPPGTLRPSWSAEAAAERSSSSSRWVGRCYACGSEVVELRHRNCANIDCNRLYLYAPHPLGFDFICSIGSDDG
ncbi:hypothetical protein PR202_gb29599 [Eleusine coracana subsp. coracana]|uniref:Rhodanese domain-containing protein n=1 Tax=Eleusine coracana subsp. coracana TaxID=191504 RepID=A0AAV5G0J8_ELECO|nr:hypothetical protein PR202_gb29599 [Eleusine coracana subsp. coracana]